MSEETPMDPLSPNAPAPTETPTPAAPAAPAEPPSLNLDSTVQVGGESYSVNDLVDMAKRGAQAEEYSSFASTLMRPDSSNEQKEEAVRYLMHQEGYNPDQIEDYVAGLNGQQEEKPQGEEMNQSDQFRSYQNQMESRMQNLEQKQSKVGVDFLRSRLNETVGRAMEENPRIQTLLSKSRELNGEEGSSERAKSIQSQLESQIIDNLRARKGKGENFSVSWFNDEAGKAADTIYDRIRSVIGDPDKIGRSPETASETEMMFSNRQPVPEPTYEAGDSVGSIDSKVRDWNTDALSRLAMDLSSGDETKI